MVAADAARGQLGIMTNDDERTRRPPPMRRFTRRQLPATGASHGRATVAPLPRLQEIAMTSTSSLALRALVCLVFVTSAGAVAAQDEGGKGGAQRAGRMQARFAAADVDHDGRLTRDEAKSGMPFVYKHFDDIDTQKAGSITMADIAAYARDRRGAKPAAK
jgi:hypothetical protein